jgi:hypothetical protein
MWVVLRLIHWSMTDESFDFGGEDNAAFEAMCNPEYMTSEYLDVLGAMEMPPTSFEALCTAAQRYCAYLETRGPVSKYKALQEQTYLFVLTLWLRNRTPINAYEANEARCSALVLALPLLQRKQLLGWTRYSPRSIDNIEVIWEFWARIVTTAFPE